MAKALRGVVLALCLGLSVAHAQSSKQNPSWGQLTAQQQQILAPIQGEWEKLDAVRRQKWIGITQRYPTMKPEEQTRLRKRMQEWAALTPEQRRAAREKYKEFEQLPVDERQAMREKWDKYKQALAQKELAAPKEQEAAVAQQPAPAEQASGKPAEGAAAEGTQPVAASPQPQQ